MNQPLQKALFHAASELTDRTPRAGARLLDGLVLPLATNSVTQRLVAARSERVLERLERPPCRILVLADIHLGDAVILQAAVSGLRDFFPEAEIHYVVSKAAARLVQGNRDVTRLHALYGGGGPLPSEDDRDAVAELCREQPFDLAFNGCPAFVQGNPTPRELPTLEFTNHGPEFLRNEQHPFEPNHFIYQAGVFLHRVLGRRFRPARRCPLAGVGIALMDEAYWEAERFLEGLDGNRGDPLVLVNPDTASRFTRPPFELQVELLEKLAERPVRVLVGEGHTDFGLGRRLLAALSWRAAARTRLVPAALPLTAHVALTDRVEVFVSGDTAPLHWAAARKRSLSGRAVCRNRTCVVGLFGATPARMSGYDSSLPGFLPAWQDAPSLTFDSHPECRNITCLNKLHKTCRLTRCFQGLDTGAVASAVHACVEHSRVRRSGLPGDGGNLPLTGEAARS